MTASTYLPPGWTQERLDNATPADFDSLPEDIIERLIEGMTTAAASRGPTITSDLASSQAAHRSALSLPPLPPQSNAGYAIQKSNLAPFVQIIRSQNYTEWGFVLFRTDYGDEERWDRFQARFDEMIEKSMDDEQRVGGEGSGVEGVREECTIMMIDDPELRESSSDEVKGHFHSLLTANMIPPGLDLAICLLVDAASMASVLDAPSPLTDSTSTSGTGSKNTNSQQHIPYVIAVDTAYNSELRSSYPQGYEGSFKVAVSSLIPDLYPVLGGRSMQSHELWPMAKPIWVSAFESELQGAGLLGLG